MAVSDYAMIQNGDTLVVNIIVADETFTMEGFYFIRIKPGLFVNIGMHYDVSTDTFY